MLNELEHARQRADSLNQLSASVKAISEKAKVSGLLVQKVEINANVTGFEDCRSWEDVIERIVEQIVADNPHAVFTDDDKAELSHTPAGERDWEQLNEADRRHDQNSADEEEIDAEVAATKPAVCVEQEDADHSDATEAVEARNVLWIAGGAARS